MVSELDGFLLLRNGKTMSYKKFLLDNITCSRRFHITFDDEGAVQAKTCLNCPHCGKEVFSAENHPAVHMQREENLVKTVSLSEHTVSGCDFVDKFSADTIPALKGQKPKPMYQS